MGAARDDLLKAQVLKVKELVAELVAALRKGQITSPSLSMKRKAKWPAHQIPNGSRVRGDAPQAPPEWPLVEIGRFVTAGTLFGTLSY